jgi:hypothetical protein
MMGTAAYRAAYARTVGGYSTAMGGDGYAPGLTAAIAMGHWGLGLLIFGAALVLVGITVQLVRR